MRFQLLMNVSPAPAGLSSDRFREETAPVAELRAVTKRFGDVTAAKNLNLTIDRGEFLSFLGPSGCGKTTALRMLAGFEQPTEGDVLIDGGIVNDSPPFCRPVNMVFQSYALFPHLTVEQNISYGLKQRRPRMDRSEISRRVARTLDTVRLAGFENRKTFEMSGGQQQRVALARAIVNEPKLLLLDEPLAALDRKLRKEMQIELQDLQRQLGITFVLVTHDQEEALSLSDRICVMRAGEAVQMGTPRDLYDDPKTKYVADFVGTSNFFEGTVLSVKEDMALVELADGSRFEGRASDSFRETETVCLSIRPEQIRLTGKAEDGAIEVVVQNRIFLGEHTEYLVRHSSLGNIIVLAPRQAELAGTAFNQGDRAWLNLSREAMLVLRQD